MKVMEPGTCKQWGINLIAFVLPSVTYVSKMKVNGQFEIFSIVKGTYLFNIYSEIGSRLSKISVIS